MSKQSHLFLNQNRPHIAPRSHSLWVSALWLSVAFAALPACENGLDAPGETLAADDAEAHETLTVVLTEAFVPGEVTDTDDHAPSYFVAPPLLVATPATRAGLMGRLKTAGEFGDDVIACRAEVRGQTAAGEWLDWQPVEVTFQEDTMFNAQADFAEPVELAELRIESTALANVAAIGWELFNVAAGEADDSGDGVTLQGVGADEQALTSQLDGLGIVTRAEWGAQSPRCTPYESDKSRFAIHHTASALAVGLTDGKVIVKGTQNYHRNVRKWCDIAYHFAVGSDGTIFEARSLDLKGGHTSGVVNGVSNNTRNIGVVMLGCFNNASGCNHQATDAMFESAGRLVHRLSEIYGIARSATTIKGHRQHTNTSNTSCPGAAVLSRIDEIRTWTDVPDTQAPNLSGNIWSSPISAGGTLVVGFSAPSDDRGVTHIRIQAGSKTRTVAYTGANVVSIDGLLAYHDYSTTVWALDAAGNTSAGITGTLTTGAFSDVGGTWYETAVQYIGEQAITAGCNPPANTQYCPLQQVSRAQLATFLTRALDLPAGPDAFDDDNGSTHESDINALAAAGITTGCGPGAYCPQASMTRGQMAAFLDRALNLPDGPDVFVDDNGTTFEANINALAAAGITHGCGGDNYCPDQPVTRAQMAVFLRNALEQ